MISAMIFVSSATAKTNVECRKTNVECRQTTGYTKHYKLHTYIL